MKFIHRFWAGDPMPDNYVEFGKKWRFLNPEWIVVEWSSDGDYLYQNSTRYLPGTMSIINKSVWDDINEPHGGTIHTAAMWTQRADVIGYEIVYKFGGLYVNTDIDPVAPLSNLFNQYPQLKTMAAAGMEDEEWIVNAVLWAPEPNMSFWELVIGALTLNYFSKPSKFMNETTGPHLLSAVAREYPDLIFATPRNVFNPIHWSDVPLGDHAHYSINDLPEETIAVHHWGHRKSGRPQTSRQ